MGLLLVVMVHSAGVQDRDGAGQLLRWALWHLPRLLTIYADGAYLGARWAWVDYLWETGMWRWCRWVIQVVQRAPGTVGFKVLPKR